MYFLIIEYVDLKSFLFAINLYATSSFKGCNTFDCVFLRIYC